MWYVKCRKKCHDAVDRSFYDAIIIYYASNLFHRILGNLMKNKELLGTLGGVSLVGILVMVCGIGLSLGFRTLSIISFFSVIILLVVMRLVGRSMASGSDQND